MKAAEVVQPEVVQPEVVQIDRQPVNILINQQPVSLLNDRQPVDQKTILTGIGGRDIKGKLTELFTPNKVKAAQPSAAPPAAAPPAAAPPVAAPPLASLLAAAPPAAASPAATLPVATMPPEDDPQVKNSESLDWAGGYMPRGRAEISEACRQAFTATCHLLLECTTFPVYMSEEETMALHVDMFDHTGQCKMTSSLLLTEMCSI